VLIQVVMVGLIIAFPNLVSVEKTVDMEEQLELRIDAPGGDEGLQLPAAEPDSTQDDTPQLRFSTDEDAEPAKQATDKAKAEEEDTTPELHFSTDEEPEGAKK
jgi:hypothetical protein